MNKSRLKKSLSGILATLIAIVCGMIVGFIVMLIANPAKAASGFGVVLTGGLKKMGDVLYYATPIMMTGLSVGFAFKMGLFNIGASGQYTMGMFCAIFAGFMFELPAGLHVLVCILAGMVGGALWGFIPGFFKAYLNVNEVITSIMFNYIGMYLVDMWIQGNSKMYVASKTRTDYLPATSLLPHMKTTGSRAVAGLIVGLVVAAALYTDVKKFVEAKKAEADKKQKLIYVICTEAAVTAVFFLITFLILMSAGNDARMNISIIAAVIIAIAIHVLLNKTTFGFELKATGFNKSAANYAGMNGKRNIILTMIIAGVLSGLGGAFAILAPTSIPGSSMTYEPINVIAANGFNGIAVALLGGSNPLGIIFSGIFISYIQRGGTLSSLYGYKPEIIDIVIAVIIYFSAFAALMNATVSSLIKNKKAKKHVDKEDKQS